MVFGNPSHRHVGCSNLSVTKDNHYEQTVHSNALDELTLYHMGEPKLKEKVPT